MHECLDVLNQKWYAYLMLNKNFVAEQESSKRACSIGLFVYVFICVWCFSRDRETESGTQFLLSLSFSFCFFCFVRVHVGCCFHSQSGYAQNIYCVSSTHFMNKFASTLTLCYSIVKFLSCSPPPSLVYLFLSHSLHRHFCSVHSMGRPICAGERKQQQKKVRTQNV